MSFICSYLPSLQIPTKLNYSEMSTNIPTFTIAQSSYIQNNHPRKRKARKEKQKEGQIWHVREVK